MLLDRDYVKRVNDSPDSAIHNTFSHLAVFVNVESFGYRNDEERGKM